MADTRNQATDKSITIYDIAEEAGVSIATVSRVLSGSAKVRESKKQKIMEIVEKYNFQPNAVAKSLSMTSTKTIGIIAADVRNPFYSALFVAIELAAEKAGYHVSLANLLGVTTREEEQIDLMVQQRVDAIIQMGGSADAAITAASYSEKAKAVNRTIPIITTGKIDNTKTHHVCIDDASATEQLMEHLLSLGHRQIAFVGGRQDVISTVIKIDKYKEILAKNKLKFRKEYVHFGGYDPETGYEGTQRFLDLETPPTAIIAVNDFAASGVIRALRDRKKKCPKDVSLVSYDNTYIADLLVPRLDSVDYNYEYFGQKLVDTALALIEKQQMPEKQTVEPVLILRGSSGKAPVS